MTRVREPEEDDADAASQLTHSHELALVVRAGVDFFALNVDIGVAWFQREKMLSLRVASGDYFLRHPIHSEGIAILRFKSDCEYPYDIYMCHFK